MCKSQEHKKKQGQSSMLTLLKSTFVQLLLTAWLLPPVNCDNMHLTASHTMEDRKAKETPGRATAESV